MTEHRERLKKEVFKPVVGYEGLYEIGSFGTLVSFPRETAPCKRIKAQFLRKNGYYQATLCSKGVITVKKIHCLVAEAFLGQRPYKHDINHKDGNKGNNHYSNLEYVTRSKNMKHAYENGLR